ncbi:hypothetical protein HUJ05_012131 [Dendroctonus ponderosae]|nr:hypothetical protein HUJ05_012131 [Dendroctonus ponderosae]
MRLVHTAVCLKVIHTFQVHWGTNKRIPDGAILRFAYSLYSYTLIIIAIMFIISEIITFRKSLTELTTVLSEIGMMFTHLVGMVKFWILIHKRDEIEQVKNKLRDVQFEYVGIDDFQPGLKMRKEKLFIIIISTFIFALYNFVGISAHISAASMMYKYTANGNFLGNTTCETFVPYYFYYPFDVSSPSSCHYLLFYMDLSLDIYASYIATFDSVFVILLNLLATQLNILGDALRTIRKRCVKRLQMKVDSSSLYDADNPLLENEMYNELTHCTKHLYLLLEVGNDIESIFTFLTLLQTIASLLIFASCLFVAARVKPTTPIFYSQLEYFSAVLSQLTVYCWFGNEITLASSAIPYSIYSSDWFSSSERFKKSMLLTMARLQRPLYVSIGKFTPLALTTLLSVIKGSFSYFTLFQSAGTD